MSQAITGTNIAIKEGLNTHIQAILTPNNLAAKKTICSITIGFFANLSIVSIIPKFYSIRRNYE